MADVLPHMYSCTSNATETCISAAGFIFSSNVLAGVRQSCFIVWLAEIGRASAVRHIRSGLDANTSALHAEKRAGSVAVCQGHNLTYTGKMPILSTVQSPPD